MWRNTDRRVNNPGPNSRERRLVIAWRRRCTVLLSVDRGGVVVVVAVIAVVVSRRRPGDVRVLFVTVIAGTLAILALRHAVLDDAAAAGSDDDT